MIKIMILTDNIHRTSGLTIITRELIEQLTHTFPNKYEFIVVCHETDSHSKMKDTPVRFFALEKLDSISDIKSSVEKAAYAKQMRIDQSTLFQYLEEHIAPETKVIIEEESPDIVISCTPYYTVTLGMINHSNKNPKKIAWWHTDPKRNFKEEGSLFEDYLSSHINEKYIDVNVSLNEYMRGKLERYCSNVRKINLGTNISQVNFSKDIKEIKRIGFVGRIVNGKQVPHLIEAFKPHSSTLEFNIIGDGRKFEKCKKKARKIPNIKFLGKIKETNEIYKNMDVLVLPSKSEGFGLVLIEAMTRGIPVITYNFDGATEIVTHNVDGIIVEMNNIEQLSDAIKKITSDIEFYTMLSKNAIETAKGFSVEKFTHEWNNLLDELLEKNKDNQ